MNMDMVCHGQSFTIIQKQTKLKSTELSCCSLHEREYEYFRHNPILTIFRNKTTPEGMQTFQCHNLKSEIFYLFFCNLWYKCALLEIRGFLDLLGKLAYHNFYHTILQCQTIHTVLYHTLMPANFVREH